MILVFVIDQYLNVNFGLKAFVSVFSNCCNNSIQCLILVNYFHLGTFSFISVPMTPLASP